jgi:hypothetical protein
MKKDAILLTRRLLTALCADVDANFMGFAIIDKRDLLRCDRLAIKSCTQTAITAISLFTNWVGESSGPPLGGAIML